MIFNIISIYFYFNEIKIQSVKNINPIDPLGEENWND